jgi:hypothetical protein
MVLTNRCKDRVRRKPAAGSNKNSICILTVGRGWGQTEGGWQDCVSELQVPFALFAAVLRELCGDSRFELLTCVAKRQITTYLYGKLLRCEP